MFDMFVDFINKMISSVMDSLFIFSINSFTDYLELNEDIFTGTITLYISSLAIALLIFMATKQGISVYITRTDGDSDQNPLEFIVRLFTATATIAANSFIYKMLYDISLSVIADIMRNINFSNLEANIAASGQKLSSDGAGGILSSSLIIGVIEVFFVIFMFKSALRACEICLMHLLLPLFAVDLITTTRERWNTFITSYVTTFISWAFQLLCIGGLVVALSHAEEGIIWTFGWIIMCLKAPKWLEKYTYTSGMGRAVGSGARTALTMVPSIIRGIGR